MTDISSTQNTRTVSNIDSSTEYTTSTNSVTFSSELNSNSIQSETSKIQTSTKTETFESSSIVTISLGYSSSTEYLDSTSNTQNFTPSTEQDEGIQEHDSNVFLTIVLPILAAVLFILISIGAIYYLKVKNGKYKKETFTDSKHVKYRKSSETINIT